MGLLGGIEHQRKQGTGGAIGSCCQKDLMMGEQSLRERMNKYVSGKATKMVGRVRYYENIDTGEVCDWLNMAAGQEYALVALKREIKRIIDTVPKDSVTVLWAELDALLADTQEKEDGA